jgi:N-acetylmuramoyl-L-alanine amidase
MRAVFLGLILWCMLPFGLAAQELSALARLDAAASRLGADGDAIEVSLQISQPVPWRVRVLANPPRMVLDVREVDWTGLADVPVAAPQVTDLRAGVFRTGWSRLVLEMAGPMLVTRSEMQTGDGPATIRLRLEPASSDAFAEAAARPEPADWALPKGADLPAPQAEGQGPVIIVLDPGHGGIDPGAEKDGDTEAALMLTFARELKDALLRDGGFAVVMTREEDVFVPLEARISIARAAGAHAFVSLHADALAEGEAQGATVYTLSKDATDEAGQALAERHDRDDLLAGLDLSAQDDLVVTVLMDMARTETEPRTNRLADALVLAIKGAALKMHRRPRQEAGFSVLKSPDIPSVLVEVGFLSSARDLKRLRDPEWRAQMVAALVAGLGTWARDDAALRALRED